MCLFPERMPLALNDDFNELHSLSHREAVLHLKKKRPFHRGDETAALV